MVLALNLYQFGQVARQHLLVAAHHGQALQQRAFHYLIRRLGIVYQFNDEVDVRVVEEVVCVVGEACPHSAVFSKIAHADTLYRNILCANTLQHIIQPTAHRAEAK